LAHNQEVVGSNPTPATKIIQLKQVERPVFVIIDNVNPSINRIAAQATLHCLTGCAIGEVIGMVLSTAWGWGAIESVALSVILAFAFGYALSMWPLLRYGLSLKSALGVALKADTASITVMEITDNAFILGVPGAINAELDTPLFWTSLATSLFVAFLVAYPLNRYLISRGRGHAVAHQYHNHSSGHDHEHHHE
jgi:hypothetical protein